MQDHEKCLWRPDNLKLFKDSGCPVVANFPKSSPDLNAIEGVWFMLKQRMLNTAPLAFECRAEFLFRLRRQVAWLNSNKRQEFLRMGTNQKTRVVAEDSLDGAKRQY